MEDSRISTGSDILDWLLEGGYEKDCITTMYGPAGSGKSNLCMLAVAHCPKGKKIIYIDTEGSFSVARLRQITDDYEDILKRVIIFQPTNFAEQRQVFEKLKKVIGNSIAMIILDSVAMLYRLEMGISRNVQQVNRELGVQLAYLVQIARKQHLPVLITNQVYADFEEKEKVKMVGGDILWYGSKCLIELQRDGPKRTAILKKHRSIEENKTMEFKIVDRGIRSFREDQEIEEY